MTERTPCNPDEAPAGFYAVPKQAIDGRNICEGCDWRPHCNDPTADFLAYGHRCTDYAIEAFIDGQIYQREDGCSVMFKRRVQRQLAFSGGGA